MNTLRIAQQRWDDMEDEEDRRAELIEGQVELLLDAENAHVLSFSSFADDACELLGDHADEMLQLVLAVYMGKTELADKIAGRLTEQLAELAEKMVIKEIDK